jgi:GNAT superfamily N-acetyltransferase
MNIEILKNQKCITAFEHGDYLGSCNIGSHEDGCWLYMLWVDPRERKQQVATRLIEFVKAYRLPIYLEPEAMQPDYYPLQELVAWYKRMGFVEDPNNPNILKWIPNV